MPVALVAAGIGAAGAVAGAAISSSGAKSAANTAAQTAANNNDLQRQIYNQNMANETPFMQTGQHANSLLDAMLTGGNTQAGQDAYNAFLNSDGYKFRLDQGLNAVNNNYATRGALNSGAALKSLNDWAQGQASNEYGKYVGYLQNQQQVGLSATNALNGVGTNFANAVSSNNNSAASAAGNAAMASSNAWSQGINGALGNVVGALNSSSYAGPQYPNGGYGTPAAVANPTSGWGGSGSQWWMN